MRTRCRSSARVRETDRDRERRTRRESPKRWKRRKGKGPGAVPVTRRTRRQRLGQGEPPPRVLVDLAPCGKGLGEKAQQAPFQRENASPPPAHSNSRLVSVPPRRENHCAQPPGYRSQPDDNVRFCSFHFWFLCSCMHLWKAPCPRSHSPLAASPPPLPARPLTCTGGRGEVGGQRRRPTSARQRRPPHGAALSPVCAQWEGRLRRALGHLASSCHVRHL